VIKLIVTIVVVFVVIIISTIASGSLSSVITTNYNFNQGATSSPIQNGIVRGGGTMSYNDIVQYALRKINEDRSRFNIPAVKLSENTAAQLEAEDMLRTSIIT
jgi:hypothetical protein